MNAKTIVVTGADGGIGAATADTLRWTGATVVGVDAREGADAILDARDRRARDGAGGRAVYSRVESR